MTVVKGKEPGLMRVVSSGPAMDLAHITSVDFGNPGEERLQRIKEEDFAAVNEVLRLSGGLVTVARLDSSNFARQLPTGVNSEMLPPALIGASGGAEPGPDLRYRLLGDSDGQVPHIIPLQTEPDGDLRVVVQRKDSVIALTVFSIVNAHRVQVRMLAGIDEACGGFLSRMAERGKE